MKKMQRGGSTKSLKKMQSGGESQTAISPTIRAKTKAVSGDGQYKTVTKTVRTPKKEVEVTREGRTLKGVLQGAEKRNMREFMVEPVNQGRETKMKRGGFVKNKKK